MLLMDQPSEMHSLQGGYRIGEFDNGYLRIRRQNLKANFSNSDVYNTEYGTFYQPPTNRKGTGRDEPRHLKAFHSSFTCSLCHFGCCVRSTMSCVIMASRSSKPYNRRDPVLPYDCRLYTTRITGPGLQDWTEATNEKLKLTDRIRILQEVCREIAMTWKTGKKNTRSGHFGATRVYKTITYVDRTEPNIRD